MPETDNDRRREIMYEISSMFWVLEKMAEACREIGNWSSANEIMQAKISLGASLAELTPPAEGASPGTELKTYGIFDLNDLSDSDDC